MSGGIGLRSYPSAMDIESLAGLELQDADGVAHRVGELMADRPVVLVFLRHYG